MLRVVVTARLGPVQQQDRIRVLLQLARLLQVVHIRLPPCALLLGAGELGQLYHQRPGALCISMQGAGDTGDLLCLIGPGVALRLDQLHIIDEDHLEAVGLADGLNLLGGHATGPDQGQPPGGEILAALSHFSPVLLVHRLALDGIEVNADSGGHQTVRKLPLAGLQREEPHVVRLGHVVGQAQGEGRLTCRRLAADNHHVAWLRIGALIDFPDAEGNIPAPLLCGLGRHETAVGVRHAPRIHAPAGGEYFAQFCDLPPALLRGEGRGKVLCNVPDALQGGLLPHQGCILPPVGGRGRDLHQLEHPALAVLAQLAPDRDRVYRRTLQQQRTGRLIDLPVTGVAQVRGIDSGQNVRHLRLIDEHGADYGILGGEPSHGGAGHCCHPYTSPLFPSAAMLPEGSSSASCHRAPLRNVPA